MTAPTSTRGWALSPTLISKRDDSCLPTLRKSTLGIASPWKWTMNMNGWRRPTTSRWMAHCLSKRQQQKGLGPSVYISAFNSIEALEKNYLAQSPSHSLTDPILRREREGVLNRIAVDKLAMKNRPLGPTLSIELPLPGEATMGFPWRLVCQSPGSARPISFLVSVFLLWTLLLYARTNLAYLLLCP